MALLIAATAVIWLMAGAKAVATAIVPGFREGFAGHHQNGEQ